MSAPSSSTGGGALAGFHLRRRETLDLDLFTTEPDAFERGGFVLADVARGLGATLVVRWCREVDGSAA